VAEENYHRSKTPNHVPDTAPGIQMTRADDSSDTRVPEDRPGAFRIPGYRGSRPSREEEEVKDEELGGRADEAYATILPFSPVSARVVDESEEARLREMEERLRAIEAGRQSPEALNPMEDGRQRPEAPMPYSHDGIKAAQAHPKDDTSSQRWCDSARSKKGLAVGAILALIATLAVIIVVVVLVVGKTPTDTPINTPTNAPSSLMGMIAAASPDQGDALQDPSTPQYKAFAWLEDNPNLGTYSDQQILRRYALAVLFYSTGGDTWDKNDGWLSNLNECDWYQSGALDVCKDGALKELNLTNNALQGTIPPEISLLSDSLDWLHLSSNYLDGPLPSEIALMTNLDVLRLWENELTGSIPSEFWLMSNLLEMNLNSNLLSGSIPSEIYELTVLQYLRIADNRLTGTLPPEVGYMVNLSKSGYLVVHTLYLVCSCCYQSYESL
jgi:hypothetical protein